MPRLRRLLAVVLGLLALAPTAGAASRNQVLRDCEDDAKLQGSYTASELRDARNNIPSDKDAYSDCRDVLSAALAADARRRAARSPDPGGTGTAGGTASTGDGTVGAGGVGVGGTARPVPPGAGAPSAEETAEFKQVRETPPEVNVRGRRVVPGVGGVAGEAAATTTVPTSVLTVLILLALCVAAGAGALVRRRVLGRRVA